MRLISQPSAWLDALDGTAPDRFDVVSNEFEARRLGDDAFAERVFEGICPSGIRHPRAVMHQAILETGWFRGPFLMSRNNWFAFRQGNSLRFDPFGQGISLARQEYAYG